MPTVKLNLVKFHDSTATQTPCSASTCSAIELLDDTYLQDIQRKKCVLTTH